MQSAKDHFSKVNTLVGKAYLKGCWFQPITKALIAEKKAQYPEWYAAHADDVERALLTDTDGGDCCGVEKFGRWVRPDGSVPYDRTTDKNEQNLYDMSTNKGPIATIPKTVKDIIVFRMNSKGNIEHMGISCGNGQVIQAKGGDFGVIVSSLTTDGWTHWGYDPYLDYSEGGESEMLYEGCPIGEAVTEWQESLVMFGYTMVNDKGVVCTIDGEFGSGTRNATNSFKADCKLPQDGKVDEITYAKMLDRLQIRVGETKVLKDTLIEKAQVIASLEGQINSLNAQVNDLSISRNSFAQANADLNQKWMQALNDVDRYSKEPALLKDQMQSLKEEVALLKIQLAKKKA